MSPMSWYCGSHDTTTVSWPAASPVVMRSKLSVRFSFVMTTPLGSDVEPDVYCKNATFCRACDSSSTRCWITRSDAADANGPSVTTHLSLSGQ